MSTENICGLKREDFQAEVQGKQTDLFILRNNKGCEVAITNYGGALVGIMVPDRDGNLANVVQGHDNIQGVMTSPEPFLSTLIGRYGNRICKGKFTLEGQTYELAINNGPNSLHGGPTGCHARVWDAEQTDGQTLSLHYVFADGDTKEWCVDADDKGRITDVSIGGNGKWYMYGSVFFDAAFSAKFVPLLERYANMSSWDGKYWEDILAAHTDDLEMYIRKFDGNVVYEFENLEELRVFDRSYLSDSRDPYIAEIKRLMSVGEADITNYAPYDSRNESKVFRFSIGQRSYAAKLHSDTKKYGFEDTHRLYEGALLTVYDLG